MTVLEMLYVTVITVTLLVAVLVVRIGFIIYRVHSSSKDPPKYRKCPVKTAIILGSGGHTAEILRIIQHLNPKHYSPRIYILAESDTSSEVKILETEEKKFGVNLGGYEILKIPRSRTVNQSYITSVFTTLRATVVSAPLLLRNKPELIICNGPGTCIPVCVLAFLMKALFICDTKIIFIESICRVKSLSLSGKILLCFADEILVQWPQLQKLYQRTVYIGRLV